MSARKRTAPAWPAGDTLSPPASAIMLADGTVEAADHTRQDATPGPGPAVAFLREHTELAALVLACLRTEAGRTGFMWTDSTARTLVRVWVDPFSDPRGRPMGRVLIEPCHPSPYGLTLRELDVLTLVVAGLTNNEIAERLFTSPRTVTTHVDRLLTKLQLSGRAAAAALALDQGLVRLPFPGGDTRFERLGLGRIATAARGGVPAPSPVPGAPRSLRRRPLMLGAALPLTGPAAADGREMLLATRLALEEINDQGGIAGRRIELVTADFDVTVPSAVRSAFTELVEQEVDALTSGYIGPQDVAHEIAADYGCPYLHAATLDSMVSRVAEDPERYGGIFQVCPSDTRYGPGFVRFLTSLRDSGAWRPESRRLMVIQGIWPLGDLGRSEMAAAVEAGGWTLETVCEVGMDDDAWQRTARQVRAAAPAAVLVGHYFMPGSLAFLRELLAEGPPILPYLLYTPSIPSFREELGPLSEGLLWATVTGTYSDHLGRSFAARFRALHGVSPGRSHAGIAYDRARMIAGAWSQVDDPRDHRRVAKAIRTTIHRGVNGAYYLADPGQAALAYPELTPDPSIGQAHLVYQIQEGHQRILSPTPYSDGRFRLPPWYGRSGRDGGDSGDGDGAYATEGRAPTP
ncbi:ABC transporter substrate-binding protein [Streptomyces sp. MAA16]|uniref:ABC transporter substrate-binding protein n=1 Tax=Streptomyces sp. MAA16 TaxID=3035116 RepID=UPI002473A8D7|nr:ABC transporter substrate-binding protein [Streptomyces sp. MAA16]MDH6695738.1 branched-chain amino acid transport system substrate-binding protein [Streptomyces sp. MAA16]